LKVCTFLIAEQTVDDVNLQESVGLFEILCLSSAFAGVCRSFLPLLERSAVSPHALKQNAFVTARNRRANSLPLTGAFLTLEGKPALQARPAGWSLLTKIMYFSDTSNVH
jgi:hypothetical protein